MATPEETQAVFDRLLLVTEAQLMAKAELVGSDRPAPSMSAAQLQRRTGRLQPSAAALRQAKEEEPEEDAGTEPPSPERSM